MQYNTPNKRLKLKKIFTIRHEKKKPERAIEAIKHEVRKYLKRERGKKLPEKATFWDFECRFGQNSDTAENLPASGVIDALSRVEEAGWEQCYIEITAKPSYKAKAPKTEEAE